MNKDIRDKTNRLFDASDLATVARQYRKSKGMTQEEVARALMKSGRYDTQLSKQAISKAENYDERDGMTALRIAIIEELTDSEVVGPLWRLTDETS